VGGLADLRAVHCVIFVIAVVEAEWCGLVAVPFAATYHAPNADEYCRPIVLYNNGAFFGCMRNWQENEARPYSNRIWSIVQKRECIGYAIPFANQNLG
jgi:hypothetical protein